LNAICEFATVPCERAFQAHQPHYRQLTFFTNFGSLRALFFILHALYTLLFSFCFAQFRLACVLRSFGFSFNYSRSLLTGKLLARSCALNFLSCFLLSSLSSFLLARNPYLQFFGFCSILLLNLSLFLLTVGSN
jgi:hypothetical protein